MVALDLQGFLTEYQSSAPLYPFLFDDLRRVVLCLARRIFKPEKLEEVQVSCDEQNCCRRLPHVRLHCVQDADSAVRLLNLIRDATDDDILLARDIDIGMISEFSTE